MLDNFYPVPSSTVLFQTRKINKVYDKRKTMQKKIYILKLNNCKIVIFSKMPSIREALAAMSYESGSENRRKMNKNVNWTGRIQTTVFTSLQARLWMMAAPRICRSSEFESSECTATLVVTLMLLILLLTF